jgi:hypothetical protein
LMLPIYTENIPVHDIFPSASKSLFATPSPTYKKLIAIQQPKKIVTISIHNREYCTETQRHIIFPALLSFLLGILMTPLGGLICLCFYKGSYSSSGVFLGTSLAFATYYIFMMVNDVLTRFVGSSNKKSRYNPIFCSDGVILCIYFSFMYV